MTNFMIRFLICNVFIIGIIGILFIVKHFLKTNLSSRMQYNLWLIMLGLLAVPFIPFRPIGLSQIISWFKNLQTFSTSNIGTVNQVTNTIPSDTINLMNDFTLSISSDSSSVVGFVLCEIWFIGILAMILLVIRSKNRLCKLKKSALPLQNSKVRNLYDSCLIEAEIHKNIPIYSTAFLRSPIIVGVLRPCIYLPIHLISDFRESDMRYMLLHELQHYKHKDSMINVFINLAGIIYWFNPIVWYALREMRNDREIACDTSVLKMLKEDDYEDYGNTLINFAEKVSLTPFPFATGISDNMKQMKKRILNIATYEKPTFRKRLQGTVTFTLIAVLLIGLTPFLSTYAAESKTYQWDVSKENIALIDCSDYFRNYNGSFVLYDLKNNIWNIHDIDHATMRVAPNSTYKIYDALFGLEENIITPEDSLIVWNGETYPFDAWNADQNLQSAMNFSVNWYFQTIDEQLGFSDVYNYIKKIGYGNENITGNFSSYWLESSLEISPIEQVELLTRLQNNSFGFALENINAVKNAICLSSSDAGKFYGKTGTGRVDGQDVNGWFVDFVETTDNTYFFATNISADTNATGSNATEITMSILSNMNIWK